MANLINEGLDPNVEESSSGFTVFPAGTYPVVIIADELKDNSAKTGKIYNLELMIIDGEFKNGTLKDRLNIKNPAEIAQKIGQGTLKKLCRLTNVTYPPEDTNKMHGIPIMATVIIEKFTSNKSGKELSGNKITGYQEYKKTTISASPAPSTNTPPW